MKGCLIEGCNRKHKALGLCGKHYITHYYRTEKGKANQTRYLYKVKYGITVGEYNNLFLAQEGRCGICGRHQTELSRKLSVDHDHETKAVRGLLCHECNTGLGLFGDDPERLTSAVKYLKK